METLLVWGLGLLALGLILVVIDIFVPTFGVLSITALAVAIAGVVCLFRYSISWGVIGSLAVLVGGPTVFFFGLQVMPSTPIGRKLVLGSGDEDRPMPSGSQAESGLADLVGKEGVVITDLRPVGFVRIGDQKHDAQSETTFIKAGAVVRVSRAEGTTLWVRPVG